MHKYKKIFINRVNWLEKIFTVEVGVSAMFLNFLGIIALRVFEERFLAATDTAILGTINGILYNFFFFSTLYLLLWLLLAVILKIKTMRLAGILLWSFWLVLLPPILDMIKTGGSVYWSFYTLDSLTGLGQEFITFFGHLPSGIVYFGTKIVFIITIFLVGGLVLIKTKSFLKAIGGAFASYVIMFFLGTLPSWLTMLFYFLQGSKKISAVNEIDIIQFFGSLRPIFGIGGDSIIYAFTNNMNIFYFLFLVVLLGCVFFWESREKTWSIIRNARLPQVLYHLGLLLVGMGLGAFIYPQNLHWNVFSVATIFVLAVSIILAWKTSVIVNDLNDYEVDKITNSHRPLQQNIFTKKEYANIGNVLFFLSMLGGLVISLKFMALLFIYQVLAWFYSARPFRLKRFPLVAGFFSSLASITIILVGYSLFSGDANISRFPWRVIFLMIVALTLSLPLKDFKDIDGDRLDGIWTLPVLFGMEMSKIIIASGIFISFVSSVFFLNERQLFWWAVLFGGMSFLIVTNRKIKPQQMMWLVLVTTFVYAIVSAKILFIKS